MAEGLGLEVGVGVGVGDGVGEGVAEAVGLAEELASCAKAELEKSKPKINIKRQVNKNLKEKEIDI